MTLPAAPTREWAAYIRVSAVMGREGDRFVSPDVQRDALAHLAPAREFQDLDRTGRNFDRPGVQDALAWVLESPRTRGLAVYNLSRLGRNTAESLRWTNQLTRAGAGLFSAYETVDTESATGQFNLRLFLSMAELQSDQISDTWRRVLSRRVEKGLPATGRPRFGYDQDEDGRYSPSPTTGPLLTDLYRRYVTGAGGFTLVADLNERGVLNAQGRTWRINSLYKMLDSGFAAGLLSTADGFKEGAHDAVITEQEWEAYTRARSRRRTEPPKRRSPSDYLSGLITCGLCGASVRNNGNGKLVCSRYMRAGRLCPGSFVRRVAVENFLGLQLAAHLDEVAALLPSRDREREAMQAAVACAEDALAQAEAALTRLTVGYAQGVFPAEDYRAARVPLEEDRDRARRAIVAARDELDRLGPVAEVPSLDGSEWGGLLKRVVRRIEVHPDRLAFVPVVGETRTEARELRRALKVS